MCDPVTGPLMDPALDQLTRLLSRKLCVALSSGQVERLILDDWKRLAALAHRAHEDLTRPKTVEERLDALEREMRAVLPRVEMDR